ncbi:MAG: hypothetical protein K2W82_10675 [Candidatus Obscuribacterales bacterium]|nr:hypothetical protein [Candidatus Obscuribacterales bacterium]
MSQFGPYVSRFIGAEGVDPQGAMIMAVLSMGVFVVVCAAIWVLAKLFKR